MQPHCSCRQNKFTHHIRPSFPNPGVAQRLIDGQYFWNVIAVWWRLELWRSAWWYCSNCAGNNKLSIYCYNKDCQQMRLSVLSLFPFSRLFPTCFGPSWAHHQGCYKLLFLCYNLVLYSIKLLRILSCAVFGRSCLCILVICIFVILLYIVNLVKLCT